MGSPTRTLGWHNLRCLRIEDMKADSRGSDLLESLHRIAPLLRTPDGGSRGHAVRPIRIPLGLPGMALLAAACGELSLRRAGFQR
jgi:hypothetical protein